MRARGVAILVALGVLAMAGGWYLGPASTPVAQLVVPGGVLMFPDLAPKLANAAKLEITHQGKQTIIEKRPDGVWGVAGLHDYPVREAKLRGVLTGLTELRLTEARTTDRRAYIRLGVDDPDSPDSSADLLRVLDQGGQPILAVIVGHRRVRSQANVPEDVYVRRPNETQVWLAEGTLQIDANAALWLNRDIIDIGHDRIASVTTSGGLVFGLVDGTFALIQPAAHAKLEDYKVEDVSRALESLSFQTVRADADAPASETGGAVFSTTDGLAVAVRLLHDDKDVWARFLASGPAAAQPEADRLNKRVAGWTYQIGTWNERSLSPTLFDLMAPDPAAPGGAK